MQGKTLRTRAVFAFVFGLIALVSYEWSGLVQKAEAIPAFARKYDFNCNVCHVPGFPKLNDFGNLFRDRGYQLGSDADLPTYEGITMGFWPVSFRTTVGYQLASARVDGGGATSGGAGFTGLDILSFGTLHRDIAFRLVYTPGLADAGFGTAPTNGHGDLESAFVKLMRLERFLGIKSKPGDYLLNFGIGKFELDVPFSEKRSQTLNTPFVMYHYQPGTPYAPNLQLASNLFNSYQNPNTFQIGNNQPGLELTGIRKTDATKGFFRYSLAGITTNTFSGALSGCSVAQQSTGQCTGTGGHGWTFFGHATQSFGGYGIVTGHRIGVFGSYGEAPTQFNPVCPSCLGVGGNGRTFSRIGADASLTYDGQWNLFGAFIHGNDSGGLFSSLQFPNAPIANAQNASWNGAFVQLDWYPTLLPFFGIPDWLFTYRYDIIRNDRQGDPAFAKNYNNVNSHTWMARYFIHQSTRTDLALHAEFNTTRTNGVGVQGGDLLSQTMLLGLDFAF